MKPVTDDEREALARLFDELRRAANANVPTEATWRLLGMIAAVCGMAAGDVRAGVRADLLRKHSDRLAEGVATLERAGP